VDIENKNLTKQIDDQQRFGKVKELFFRVYWTANPERIAIEVMGLPDGFKELKEELKITMMGILDNLIPQTFEQRFAGYKFISGAKPREIIASDTTGMAPIPSFLLKFDEQDRLVDVLGQKLVGTMDVRPVYAKEPFAEGRWVLVEQKMTSSENGQSMTVSKKLEYGKTSGIGVLTYLKVTTEQQANSPKSKPIKSADSFTFKNYKINEGVALKYFLGEGKTSEPNSGSTP
jgi:hypothetical protein